MTVRIPMSLGGTWSPSYGRRQPALGSMEVTLQNWEASKTSGVRFSFRFSHEQLTIEKSLSEVGESFYWIKFIEGAEIGFSPIWDSLCFFGNKPLNSCI